MSFFGKLDSMHKDCLILADDINAITYNKSTNETESTASRKSLEPVTRLRKDSNELKEAEGRDPQDQFILDKLSDIFG